MRTYMYLRPGNLYKDFVIEKSTAEIGSSGRVKRGYQDQAVRLIKGILSEADPEQKVRWGQLQHPVTHTILQDGAPAAKPEDKLILGDRIFLIKGVDQAGDLGICTIYYAEERLDVL